MKCAAVLLGLLTAGACMGADTAVPPVPLHKEIALDASTLENYVGHYKASDGIFAIVLKDGQLQAQFTDQSGFSIYASAKDKFFYKVCRCANRLRARRQGKSHRIGGASGRHR